MQLYEFYEGLLLAVQYLQYVATPQTDLQTRESLLKQCWSVHWITESLLKQCYCALTLVYLGSDLPQTIAVLHMMYNNLQTTAVVPRSKIRGFRSQK